jgi:hypothetical protein
LNITIKYDPNDLSGALKVIEQARRTWPEDDREFIRQMDERIFSELMRRPIEDDEQDESEL